MIAIDEKFSSLLDQKKAQLNAAKSNFANLKTNYNTLQPRERARLYKSVEDSIRDIKFFVSQVPRAQITNSGVKFSYDNLDSSFRSLHDQWRKFEMSLGAAI